MAESVHSRRAKFLAYIVIGVGLLAFALCGALAILLGTTGIDIHITQTYFVIAHHRRLGLFCAVIGIAAVLTLARTLYARFIGS